MSGTKKYDSILDRCWNLNNKQCIVYCLNSVITAPQMTIVRLCWKSGWSKIWVFSWTQTIELKLCSDRKRKTWCYRKKTLVLCCLITTGSYFWSSLQSLKSSHLCDVQSACISSFRGRGPGHFTANLIIFSALHQLWRPDRLENLTMTGLVNKII